MGQGAGSWAAAYQESQGWFVDGFCSCREPLDWQAAEEKVEGEKFETELHDSPGAVRQPLQGAPMLGGGSRPSYSDNPMRPVTLDRASTTGSLSAARSRQRLRTAILKVKAVNRIAKTVSFSEETVVCFEVHSQGSDDYNSLVLADKVVWSDADDDVPKGSIGEIIGFSQGGIVQVRFPKGVWDFRAVELSHQDTWSAGVARGAIQKAEKLMRDLQVLEAEACLAEAMTRLNEAVSLEKFDPDLVEEPDEKKANGSGGSTPEGSTNAITQGRSSPVRSPAGSRSGTPGARLERSNSNLSGTRSPGTRRASLLSVAEAAEARAAIARMAETPIYQEVALRAGQYQGLGRAMAPAGFRLLWQSGGNELWVHSPPRASWFEYKLVCELPDASLTSCVAACTGEPDLVPRASHARPRDAPAFVGRVHHSRAVSWSVVNVLLYRIDVILEKFRWYNAEYGFFAESMRSSFPMDKLSEKKAKGSSKRVAVNAQHLWIPRGGGEEGTVCIQLVRVDFGSRLARWLLNHLSARAGPALAEELRAAVMRGGESGAPLKMRIADDRHGLYAQLAKVEAAAARRPTVTASALPCEEVLKRLHQLPTRWP